MRQVFNDGQEIKFSDFYKLQQRLEKQLYDRVLYEMMGRRQNAFFANSMKVTYVGPSSVSVTAGLGFQFNSGVTDPEPTMQPVYLLNNVSKTLANPDPSNNRIDVVAVRYNKVNGATESRKFKAAGTGIITNEMMVVSEDYLADVTVVTGTAGSSPAVPATPAGYIKVAEILVVAVTGLANQAGITDKRARLPGRLGLAEATDYEVLGSDPTDFPAAGSVKQFHRAGTWYQMNSAGVVTPLNQGSAIATRRRVTFAMSPYAIQSDDEIVEFDLSGGNIVANLAAGVNGKQLRFKVIGDPVGNNATVNGNGGEQVEGTDGNLGTSIVLDEKGQGESLYCAVVSSVAKWWRS